MRLIKKLCRSPGYALTTVLTLAVGIGATTAIFAVVSSVLLEPLPYRESDRLIELQHRSSQSGANWLPISPAIYFTYRDHSTTLESIAIWLADTASVTGAGDPEEVPVLETTFEFLATVGVAPSLGRGFTAADDAVGSPRTVILSHSYWQRRFGGNEDVLGRSIVVDGAPHTVIGVLPRAFTFETPADMLLPMQPDPAIAFVGPLGENGIARLRDGVTLAQANADLDRLIPLVSETFPPVPGMDLRAFANLRLRPDVLPLKEAVVGDLNDLLWLMLGAIGLLLVVACANVANLHLVRTEQRSHELAIRSALGASTPRIAGELLGESTVLALAGGVLGVAMAATILPVLLAFASDFLPRAAEVSVDATVVAFALAASIGAGLVVGLTPALKYFGSRAALALGTAGRSYTAGAAGRRIRHLLIVAQVAFALILLVAAALMLRTATELRSIDAGFVAPERVQTVTITIPAATVPEFPTAVRMLNEMQDRLAELGGVASVGFASRLPLSPGPKAGFFIEGQVLPAGEAPPLSDFRYTSPAYFETIGTPLVAGRTFDWPDHREPRRVAIVSENLARRAWGAPERALGERLQMTPAEPWREIVGVVGDVRMDALEQPVPTAVYLTLGDPLAQFIARKVSFVIRSDRVGTAGFLEDIQRAIWSVDARLPLASVETLDDIYRRSMARTSLTLVLLCAAGALSLLLGLIGIYGTISYVLAQRTREIGIRVALGAKHGALRRLLLEQVVVLVGVGVALGLGGAAALARLMSSLLFGVGAFDAASYFGVSLLVIVVALLAGYLPARRVTRVDPLSALRAE